MEAQSTNVEDMIPIVRAMPSTSSGSTTYPLKPGRTSSATQPHRCDTMTGRLAAIASFTTSPHVSLTLGKIRQEANP